MMVTNHFHRSGYVHRLTHLTPCVSRCYVFNVHKPRIWFMVAGICYLMIDELMMVVYGHCNDYWLMMVNYFHDQTGVCWDVTYPFVGWSMYTHGSAPSMIAWCCYASPIRASVGGHFRAPPAPKPRSWKSLRMPCNSSCRCQRLKPWPRWRRREHVMGPITETKPILAGDYKPFLWKY